MTQKRLAIVTGGARGIGRAIVFALIQQNRKVAAIDINQEMLDELINLATEKGVADDLITEKLDITDSKAFTETIERLAEEHGGIGILVNNAGITRDGLLMTMKDEDFDKVIEINLKAAFIATRAATRSMMRNRWGRIINIASVAGVMGNAGQTNYAASKAGLIGMAKTVARELAKRNVTANCVAPGFIITEMTGILPERVLDGAKQIIPMKKLGAVDDVAAAVAFFASDPAGYITGQVMCVDGGMVM
ncbi:MAG: 3-oxoacyl-[acyl-carrier-protein] reductase [Planctomycetes bacterium]|nr:3-oxoacyl-[acyl-carrier-protein] reductase [Planctomycetota bacterium]